MGTCQTCEPAKPLIIQGEDKVLVVRLTSQTTGLPFDISSASAIESSFLKSDKTYLKKTLANGGIVIVNGVGGVLQILLDPTDTGSLEVGYGDGYQSITLSITIAGKKTLINFENAIQVAPQQNSLA